MRRSEADAASGTAVGTITYVLPVYNEQHNIAASTPRSARRTSVSPPTASTGTTAVDLPAGVRDLGAVGAAGLLRRQRTYPDPEQSVPGWAFLGVGMFLLSGLQLILMGVIGTYLGRAYLEAQGRPLYSVAFAERGPRNNAS